MTRLRKRKKTFKSMIMNFNNIIAILMSLIFLIGTAIGTFILILSDLPNTEALWKGFTENNNIFESIFKYGKIILAIWLCGFFKYGFIGTLAVIFIKGISIGYTSSFIIKLTGARGILFISKLYLLQTAILFLMCLITGIMSVKFSLRKTKNIGKIDARTYYSFGILQIIGIIFIALIDNFGFK